MGKQHLFSEIRLVNGSAGDPSLYIDYPGKHDGLLFDCGENCVLDRKQLNDLRAVFLTHHHMDHVAGFDRVFRANLDSDKTLDVFGPVGTIAKLCDRIRSYEYANPAFQRLTLRLHEVLADCIRGATIECRHKLGQPEIEESHWAGPVIYESQGLVVEAAHVEHTAPTLSYALLERTGYHPDRDRLSRGLLRPGPWVGHVQRLLQDNAPLETSVEIQGGAFPLSSLADQYFRSSPGVRIAYVTDTAWTDMSQKVLVGLAQRAQRLYCDSFYAQAQLRQAVKYRHMTAAQAGELARRARVEELILIHFANRYVGKYEMLVEQARQVFPATSAIL